MKLITILNLFVAALLLISSTTACKKKPTGTTIIPKNANGIIGDGKSSLENGGVLPTNPNLNPDGTGIEAANRDSLDGRTHNTQMFATETVYFAVDSASIKSNEKSKLESVAQKFKAQPAGDLLIEGHCDERGTEGYNLTLGDKRANSLREYLANLGVPADKIHTLSLGESKPAATGNGESAWSKNRRGEFIFVEPAK